MTASLSDAACAKGAGAWASVGAAGVPIGPEAAGRGGADEHYELTQTERSAWGRCSIWWRNTPDLSGRRTGLIGHFASNDRVLSGRVLRQACAALAARGCAVAVGPMDGSTWRPYRLVTERGTEPPFFLEPDHPPEWPEDFCEAGFAPVAEYFSAVTDRLDCEDPRADRAEARLLGLGIEVRSLDAQRWEQELGEVYRVTLNSFRDAFLYQPLPSAEFHALYGRLRPVVVPELVLLARHRGRAVGYVVGIPDRLQAARGAALEHHGFDPRSSGVQGGGQAGRPSADDDHVVLAVFLHRLRSSHVI